MGGNVGTRARWGERGRTFCLNLLTLVESEVGGEEIVPICVNHVIDREKEERDELALIAGRVLS
jgi:hypothetical protein